jgi:hypothetical protein
VDDDDTSHVAVAGNEDGLVHEGEGGDAVMNEVAGVVDGGDDDVDEGVCAGAVGEFEGIVPDLEAVETWLDPLRVYHRQVGNVLGRAGTREYVRERGAGGRVDTLGSRQSAEEVVQVADNLWMMSLLAWEA